ncbi:MAG TPA: FAD-dependent oxidoreductase [Candidatus Paceibacterota bacterium]|nr:FAD-dependent oxidoreductase [Candidatus Paceibacterota bacterium]
MYDLIIVGGGPGGVAAGVYAARKKLKAVLVTESFGGQSITSAEIQNWIGAKSISGFDLAKSLEEHVRAQEGLDIMDSERVSAVRELPDGLEVALENGKKLETKYLLVVSGSRRRKLGVPGEHELDGRGVAYCSTCDAPVFRNRTVAVVGGGNAGLEAVRDLLPYAAKVILLEFAETLKGDAVTQEQLRANPKVTFITRAKTEGILGEREVTGLEYTDLNTNEKKTLEVGGVFVEVGILPNSEFVKDLVKLDPYGFIIVDHKTQRTSHPRIWAAGDITDQPYRQNNIAAGDAAKAVLCIGDIMHGHSE